MPSLNLSKTRPCPDCKGDMYHYAFCVIGAHGSTEHPRDNCQFCLGTKGGVKGNENVFGKVVVCDYCTPLVQQIIDSVTKKFLRAVVGE